MTQYRTVSELIDKWPSAEIFSDDLALKYRSHGRVMKLRNRIPQARWDAVVLAASKRGIDGITHRVLAELHAASSTSSETAKPAEASA